MTLTSLRIIALRADYRNLIRVLNGRSWLWGDYRNLPVLNGRSWLGGAWRNA